MRIGKFLGSSESSLPGTNELFAERIQRFVEQSPEHTGVELTISRDPFHLSRATFTENGLDIRAKSAGMRVNRAITRSKSMMFSLLK